MEEFWLEDVLYLMLETRRLRRLKARLLESKARYGLTSILESLVKEVPHEEPLSPVVNQAGAERLTKEWFANDPAARCRVDELLKSAGLSMDTVLAETLAMKLDEFERIDRTLRFRRRAAPRPCAS